jgi:glycosyltransferase involved in cell wall biosynthesis
MPTPTEQPVPFVSVIIPTYRRPASLRRLLGALLGATYPADRFEVVVVDDGGGVPLDPIVDEFDGVLQLTLLCQENTGPAGARNAGAAAARGELLVFVDDDCRPEAAWLEILLKSFGPERPREPMPLCGGQVINELASNPYSTTSQLVLDIIYEQVNADPSRAEFLTTNNMAVSSEQFRAMGGFDAGFRTAEDREFCDRWQTAGRRLNYDSAAVVWHAHDLGFWSFCWQHFNYGRGAWAFHAKRGSGSMRGSINFHRDPRKWLAQPFLRGAQRPLAIAALLVVWQFANALGFGWGALSAIGNRARHDRTG